MAIGFIAYKLTESLSYMFSKVTGANEETAQERSSFAALIVGGLVSKLTFDPLSLTGCVTDYGRKAMKDMRPKP